MFELIIGLIIGYAVGHYVTKQDVNDLKAELASLRSGSGQ